MAANDAILLSAADLENRFDQLLHNWAGQPGADEIGVDQRMQVLARLRQLQQQAPDTLHNSAAILGPLLCKSPESLAAFREFCINELDAQQPQLPNPGAAEKPVVEKSKSHTDIQNLSRRLRLLAVALAVTGALAVMLWAVWAGWPEWKQKLCEFEFWEKRYCQVVIPPVVTPGTGAPPVVVEPKIYEPGQPIIEPVVVGARQPPLRFVRADLEQQTTGVFRSRWWLVVPPLIGLLLGWLFARYKRRSLEQQLSKLPTWQQQLDLIDLSKLPRIFIDPNDRKAIAAAQYSASRNQRLDIRRTIDASVRAQFPSLVKQPRQVRGEYLFVIPMQTSNDWRGQYFATLVKELRSYQLQVHLFFYRRNPQHIYPAGHPARAASLDYWRQQYSNSKLVVLADQQALFHPVFGNPLAWLKELYLWPQHLLVFTSALSASQLRLLQVGGYHLHNGVDTSGITRLLHHLADSGSTLDQVLEESSSGYALPQALTHLGEIQAMTETPNDKQVLKVVRWLKYRLGPQGFRLFCASVIFPRPDWRLTRGLAHRLADAPSWHSGELLMHGSPKLLAPLARLPWCRHGYFPLWLRRALYDQLSPDHQATVTGLLRSFLRKVDNHQVDPMQLSVDTLSGSLSDWLRWVKRDGPAHDVLFATVLNRGRLSFLLDRLHWRNMHNRVQAAATAVAGTLLAGLLGWFIWSVAPKAPSDEELVARRCGLNNTHTVRIEHTAALFDQAKALQESLKPLCYTTILEEVRAESVVGQNSYQAAPSQAVLLGRALSYALYNAPLQQSHQSEAADGVALNPAESKVSLVQPIMSGQVFRAAFVSDAPLPQPVSGETVARPSTNPVTGTAGTVQLAGPQMVLIPADVFTMGSSNGADDEQPTHSVSIAAFEMSRFEVTWRDWQACEEAGVCDVLERPEWINDLDQAVGSSHPVVNVSWDQAQVYIGWLNAESDGGYRLPSEAEFEYALRAGTDSDYPWGADSQCEHSNGADQSTLEFNSDWPVADCNDGYTFTAPVGTFALNDFKLHDLSGNAWEWVEDCWNGNYEGAPTDGSAWVGSGDCDRRVLRGGGWGFRPENLRSAYRLIVDRSNGYFIVGFRLARTP